MEHAHRLVHIPAAGQLQPGRIDPNRSGSADTYTVTTDHVVAGTGYEVNMARIPFLSPELVRKIRLWDRMPRLSRHFESSVRGLFFIGPIAAESFGPLVRFIAGTEFTVSVVAAHLSRKPGMLRSVLGRPAVRAISVRETAA